MYTINTFKNEAKKFTLFFTGLSLTALGSVHMIRVFILGVQPFDTLYIGLYKNISMTIGTSSIIIGFVLLIVSFLLTKERLKIGTILDTIFLRIFVDFFLHIDLIASPDSLIWRYVFLLFGILLISFGSALTIFSNLGAGPIDTFMLSIHKKFKLSVKTATTMIEVFALAAGFLLGGPVGFGTLLYLLLIGPLIEVSLHILSILSKNEREQTLSIGEEAS